MLEGALERPHAKRTILGSTPPNQPKLYWAQQKRSFCSLSIDIYGVEAFQRAYQGIQLLDAIVNEMLIVSE